MAVLYKLGQSLQGRLSTYTVTKDIYNTVWLASSKDGETVVVKGARHSRIHRERDVLQMFQSRAPIRPLIDEIVEPNDPPGIVLRHLESDLLSVSASRTMNRSEIKYVARTVLKALAVLHGDGYVHTGEANFVNKMNGETNCRSDIKPNNVLYNLKSEEEFNKDESDVRFSEALLADFGSCVQSTSNYAQEEQPIGATIFRSPEANLKLPWGSPTDIWSFGAMILSLFFGNYHIFSPTILVDDPNHDRIVLERMHMFFGPFPLTYKTLAPRETRDYLATIMNSVGQLKPFHMIRDKEFQLEDKAFLLKIMKLDPRDRPTAKQLLADPWLS